MTTSFNKTVKYIMSQATSFSSYNPNIHNIY